MLVVWFSFEIIRCSQGAQGVKLNEKDWEEMTEHEKFPAFGSTLLRAVEYRDTHRTDLKVTQFHRNNEILLTKFPF